MEEDWDALPSRRYLEAYPRLKVVKAVRGVRTGHDCVLWRDQNGEPVGTAVLKLVRPDTLRISATIHATRYLAEFEGSVSISLTQKPAGKFRVECYAVCACGREVKVLIFKRHSWRCSKCHELVNRSAVISRPIRLCEQLAKVTEALGSGRKPNMHNSTYRRLLDERDRLEGELNGFEGVANSDYTGIINDDFLKLPTGWSAGQS